MKSLSALLADLSCASLTTLAGWWGAPPPTGADSETRQRLERAMRDTVSARFVWERLNARERLVLFAVVGPSARNWCPRELVAERAKVSPAEAERVLDRLIEHHLLFAETARVQGGELVGQRATFYGYAIPRNAQALIEEKPIVYVPTELATGLYATGRELFVAPADRSKQTLDDLLLPYRQGDLDQIGRRFGLTIQAYYSRNEVRAAMAENLCQAEAVCYALGRIDPPLRALYEWLRAQGGRVPLTAVRAHLRQDGPALGALVRTLEEYALVFDTFSAGERILFIPQQVLANLRQADERPRPMVGLVESTTPQAVLPADTPFLWDLAALVAAACHQEIELTRAGALPKRAALRLLPLLTGARERHGQEEALVYLEQLKQEACELGIITAPPSTAATRGRLAPGPKLDSWARHDLVMQMRRVYRRWPANRWWADALGVHYENWLAFYIEQPVAREAVRDLLRRCEPGVWYTLDSFRATVQGDDPFVLRPSQRNAGEAGFRLANELRARWEGTDGEVIAGIFSSTLRELGLVELGYARESVPPASKPANPDAFRLTELGAEVLTSELSAAQQPSPRPLVVQPNFQVLLLEPHMPALYWLVRHASLEQVGRVSRFALTRETLARALAGGAGIDEVIGFLTSHSQKALPQNVVYTLRDWARQQQAPRVRGVTLLEVGDAALAAELVTSPKLRAFQLRRVGHRKIAVPPEASRGDLRRALERLGYASRLLSGLDDLVAAATTLPGRRRARPSAASVASRAGMPAVKGAG
ncbi:MAG TPA: helicase-associated domain-containing protein [Ktedonobacterales bacterium]|nr:helicase-associated domain-containing protein [Ktedonobacterales bacterium]